MSTENKNNETDNGIVLMPHEYDGIQEYDQRLPNWWLFTLYGAIVFSVFYWFFYFQSNVGTSDVAALQVKMQRVEAVNLEATLAMLNDDNLWKMSRNPEFVNAGEVTFMTQCASCHGEDLKGGIGVDLIDDTWIHGNAPKQVYQTVDAGVVDKGMPTWGPILGPKRVAEVVAFVLSHHDQGADNTIE